MKRQLLVLLASIPMSTLSASLALAASADTGGSPPGAADFAAHCAGCHSVQLGKNGVGPSLSGIYGSTSATVPGYTFSPALRNAHLVWDDQSLNKFLQNPSGVVRGTKMFSSVPDNATRQRIVTYLQTLKSSDSAKN